MKLGVNTVLFKKFSVREAVLMAKRAGYDGVELSAIQGMCEHLVLDEWEKQKDELIALREETGMEFLSMEAATNDRARIEKAFAAAQALGIPLVNIGSHQPGDFARKARTHPRLQGPGPLSGRSHEPGLRPRRYQPVRIL